MSATERQLNPTRLAFEENRDAIAPAIQEQLPERGGLSNYFSMQVGMGLNPLEPQMEMPTLADNSNETSLDEKLKLEVIANNTIQVSENLTNAPTEGIKFEPTSDAVYATKSFFSIFSDLGESLGLKSNTPDEPDAMEPQIRMANAFDFQNIWNGPRAPMA